jgi:hypothetical protein
LALGRASSPKRHLKRRESVVLIPYDLRAELKSRAPSCARLLPTRAVSMRVDENGRIGFSCRGVLEQFPGDGEIVRDITSR